MKYLLDTDICFYIIKRRPEAVFRRFRDLAPGDVGISSVTLSELCFGVEKSLDPSRNREALEAFLVPLEVAPFEASAAFRYGGLRAALERAGKPIGSMDMLIASHALALSVPLVTNNVREFSRVPGLKLENWAEGT